MTREEALNILHNASVYHPNYLDALNMALKALEQEPCEDAVSRQEVLDIIEKEEFKGDAISEIEKLPSVNPQKIGHWIIEKWNNKEHYSCSSCQHVVDYEPCYHYCPYCGARMFEPQESEDKE